MENSSAFVASMVISVVIVLGIFVPQAEARAFFVFNNYLLTTARADAYPYGIDYPTHRATGRFSNGLNIPDIISKISLIFHVLHFIF
ncbi:hypothetical protein IFM89_020567 [Coptis chinensis]|uniref:Uncharacterized protein n=1 Tax=Coptis chinensis TaxID=261450 RepID=A0A835ID72_9MAGN|nr:hypothetical protein IFM89_017709 [Coptis chinensis]KAF9614734.1 hypothetical protein IFM89_020567 [Coptis chinensis]